MLETWSGEARLGHKLRLCGKEAGAWVVGVPSELSALGPRIESKILSDPFELGCDMHYGNAECFRIM